MSLLTTATDMCDKYAAPASCNTENPPAIFTPEPAPVQEVVTNLAMTGGDPMVIFWVLVAGAFTIAIGGALIVLSLRRRRKS